LRTAFECTKSGTAASAATTMAIGTKAFMR
jgi:hypothetical protein